MLILDTPFAGLSKENADRVECMLRRKQSEGAVVIIAMRTTEYTQENDKVVIVNAARTKEYGLLGELTRNPRSSIDNFLRSRELLQSSLDLEEKRCLHIAKRFQSKVRKAALYKVLFETEASKREEKKKVAWLIRTAAAHARNMLLEDREKKEKEEKISNESKIDAYLRKFVRACSWS